MIQNIAQFKSALGLSNDVDLEGSLQIFEADLYLKFSEKFLIDFFEIQFISCFVTIENANISGFIEFDQCNITMKNSKFSQNQNSTITHYIQLKQSTAELYNCSFYTCSKVQLNCLDNSKIKIHNSLFSGSNIAIQIIRSDITIIHSKFEDSKEKSIYIRESKSLIDSTEFQHLQKPIVVIQSHFTLSKCSFESPKSSLLNCISSHVQIQKITSNQQPNSCLFDFEDCRGSLEHFFFSSTLQNLIKLIRCQNFQILNCSFRSCQQIPILIYFRSNVEIANCTFTDLKTSAMHINFFSHALIYNTKISTINIAIKVDHCSECFCKNLQIEKSPVSAIIVSDFSKLHLQNSIIRDCAQNPIEIFNGGEAYLNNSEIHSKSPFFIYIHHGGKIFLEHSRFYGECNIIIFRDLVQQVFVFETTFNTKLIPNMSSSIEKNHNICIKCRHRANGPFCNPCFHQVYCKKCFQEENPKVCPWCQSKIESSVEEFPYLENECSICMFNQVNVIILPCLHMICNECLLKCINEKVKCPFCQKDIESFQLFFKISNEPNS